MGTTGVDFDLWVFVIPCENCDDPTLLPRQSPLGKFEGPYGQPMDVWPATLLCQKCGQVFSYLAEKVGRGRMPVQHREGISLLWLRWKDAPNNSAGQRGMYTSYSRHLRQDAALSKLRAYVQKSYGEAVEFEAPESWSCE